MDQNNNPAPIKARGRGRPKKVKPIVDFLLPTIIEKDETPRMVVVDDPEPVNFTEVVSLNGGLDLSDIAKPVGVEDAWHAEAEPVEAEPVHQDFNEVPQASSMPSFSLGLTPSPIVPQASSESESDRKERLLLIGKLKRYATEFPAFAGQAINPDAPINVLKNQSVRRDSWSYSEPHDWHFA